MLLAVADPSDKIPTPKEPDFISENGRGLYIVETYSQCWAGTRWLVAAKPYGPSPY